MVSAIVTIAAHAQSSSAMLDAVHYATAAPDDPVARLQKKIDAGSATLAFDKDHGYLPAVLKALGVPVSSQGLVFSRTSLQVDKIAPWSPRAIYFNDDVYVGWVQNGPIMEVASVDPVLGGVFYTLRQEASDHPVFERQTQQCLQCHDSSSSTGGVPGFIMRSVIPDRYGYVMAAGDPTTDRTPLEKRWGGWYVTGTMGNLPHAGNVNAPVLTSEAGNIPAYLARTPVVSKKDITDLRPKFDVDPYLAPHSDAVALLVLAHQANVHNLITDAGYQARMSGGDNLDMRAKGAAERLVRALLFVNAAPIAGPVKGTSAFAQEFPKPGSRDAKGRSLRDLDLTGRLFKYPLSYLIDSGQFDALPAPVKKYVYERLQAVLGGADSGAEFAHLTADDRLAITQILKDTKPEAISH
jgi:hypothetical protein